MERTSRTELLIGKEKMALLGNARVLVVGLGAVGSHCVEALARAGVKYFRLVDFDIIRESNINRHIWAIKRTVNFPKTQIARERLFDIDPSIEVDTIECFAAPDTFDRILGPTVDIAIDAIDSLNPKIQFLTECWKREIKTISSMGAATRTEPMKVRTADIFDTKVCPLAARIRRRLKEQGVGRGISCVYSEEHQDVHSLSEEALPDAGDYLRGRTRRRLGSLSTLTGIFGLTLAQSAIDIITAPRT